MTPWTGGHKQNLAGTKIQRKEAVTPQEAEPKLPASVGWPPVEAWASTGSPQGWGDWQQLSGKVPFGRLLEVTINPTREPVGPRAGPPQAKKLPRREPIHQQIIGLKLY